MTRRAIVVGHEASRSGAPRVLDCLLQEIVSRHSDKWGCDVWLRDGGDDLDYWQRTHAAILLAHHWSGHRSVRSRFWRRFWDRPYGQPRAFRRSVSRLPAGEHSVIHLNTITNGDLLPILAQLGLPTVIHVHEAAESLHRFVNVGERRNTLKYATQFIAVSSSCRDDLIQSWNLEPSRVSVVPNFIRSIPAEIGREEARCVIMQQRGIPIDGRFVVVVGNIDRIKGPDLFLDALGRVGNRLGGQEQIRAAWVGGISDHGMARLLERRLALDLGLKSVHWPGRILNVPQWMAAADVVVVTSREESFSMVALEAAALGRPVVCFAGARGPLEVLGRRSELVAPGFDVASMADRIVALLRNPEMAEVLGRELRELVASRFLARDRVPEILGIWEAAAELWRGR